MLAYKLLIDSIFIVNFAFNHVYQFFSCDAVRANTTFFLPASYDLGSNLFIDMVVNCQVIKSHE